MTFATARLRPVLLLLLPFLIAAAITRLDHPTDFDEGDYHVPVVERFAETLPRPDLVHYRSATTPLMHLALAVWGRIAGFEIWKLRVPVLLAGVAAALVFRRILHNTGDGAADRNVFFLILYPYFFWLSFIVMTEVVALLFGLLALHAVLRPHLRRRHLAWFALWAALAVWTRQQWLFLPLAAASYWAWQDRNLRRAIWALLPLAAVTPLFIAWQGTNPPIFFATSHAFVFNPAQYALLLIFVGFYFAPAVLMRQRQTGWRPMGGRTGLLWAGVALAGALFLPHIDPLPENWAILPYQRDFVGNLAQFGELAMGVAARVVGPAVAALVVLAGYSGLYLIGAVAIGQAWQESRARSGFLWYLLAVFLAMTLLVAQPWERYLLPALPVLILLLYSPLKERQRWLDGWLGVQTLLLAGFLIYQLRGNL